MKKEQQKLSDEEAFFDFDNVLPSKNEKFDEAYENAQAAVIIEYMVEMGWLVELQKESS